MSLKDMNCGWIWFGGNTMTKLKSALCAGWTSRENERSNEPRAFNCAIRSCVLRNTSFREDTMHLEVTSANSSWTKAFKADLLDDRLAQHRSMPFHIVSSRVFSYVITDNTLLRDSCAGRFATCQILWEIVRGNLVYGLGNRRRLLFRICHTI